ncbi:hypothetical protein ACXO7E_09515, partial [Lactobacillus delbrueckii subsp. bulgaricus]
MDEKQLRSCFFCKKIYNEKLLFCKKYINWSKVQKYSSKIAHCELPSRGGLKPTESKGEGV